MKKLLCTFGMALCLLGAFPSMAEEARLQQLVSQAEAAIAHGDRHAADRLIDEIYELTTGLDPALKEKPKHLSGVDYQIRLCPYWKAIEPLKTPEEINYDTHGMRAFALQAIQLNIENGPYVSAVLECTHEHGKPSLQAQALRNGLVWAKKLNAANIDELQVMLQEYEMQAEQYPEHELFKALHEIIALTIDRHHAANEAKESQQRLEAMNFQKRLVEQADKGDLGAQLEVARRLETGDKFKQNNHFAYFWYKRALQNGGGETAQSGMDRLLPNLDEIDLMRVDNWLEKKYLMY